MTRSDSIIELHTQGLTNRKIAKTLGINHKTVSYYLREKNLSPNGTIRKPINLVSEHSAQCNRCSEIKNLDHFQVNRRGQKYEYRFGFCNECRREKVLKNLNSDNSKILRDIFNRLKTRCSKNKIRFELTFEYFCKIRELQNDLCFYSNEKMDLIRGKGFNHNTLTTDKIVPEKGYVEGNIVFCSKRFNTVKSDLSLDEIAKHMPSWYEKLRSTEWITL